MCISTARLIRYTVFVASDIKKLSGGQNKHNTKVTEQVANTGFFFTKEKGFNSSYPYTSYPKDIKTYHIGTPDTEDSQTTSSTYFASKVREYQGELENVKSPSSDYNLMNVTRTSGKYAKKIVRP